MSYLNEAMNDLLHNLDHLLMNKNEAAEILARWASNQFAQLSVMAMVDHEQEARGGVDLKAHLIRQSVIDASLKIAAECGFGEEETKMPWGRQYGRNIDHAPMWNNSQTFFKELRLSFFCLKRKPASWYRNESTDEWMSKLIGVNP